MDALFGRIQNLSQLLVFILFLTSLLLLLKRGISVSLLGNVLIGVSFLFTVYLIYDGGGLVSPLVIYLMVMPAFIVLISDSKWVALWTIASVVAVSMFLYLHIERDLTVQIQDSDGYLTNAASNYIFAIIFIAILFLYSDKSRLAARYEMLKAMKRSDDLLLNVLPEETANELKEEGTSPARLFNSATVLFTDFKGFTEASENMRPEELVEVLNDYFMHFDRIMDKYGIEKIKTIGDSYMAAGGLPKANNSHAVDVVTAALEIRDWVNKPRYSKNHSKFQIRIGVHTGPVVAGIVGIKKFQYDIWGDTVNTASRMESSGEVGKVNISRSTYELVKDQFNCIHRGKVIAKGKGEMEMYFVEKLG